MIGKRYHLRRLGRREQGDIAQLIDLALPILAGLFSSIDVLDAFTLAFLDDICDPAALHNISGERRSYEHIDKYLDLDGGGAIGEQSRSLRTIKVELQSNQ